MPVEIVSLSLFTDYMSYAGKKFGKHTKKKFHLVVRGLIIIEIATAIRNCSLFF
jgi:hypothetical protein